MNAIGFDIGGGSVKAAWIRGGEVAATTRSAGYDRPSAERLAGALAECVEALGSPGDVARIGLCLPGVLSADGRLVERCVNIPALEGVAPADLVGGVLPRAVGARVFGDAHAAAVGYWREHPGDGRLLGLAIGTGVGACVLDAGVLLRVAGESSGHIGQVDVGPCGDGDPPLGPDGGRHSLEAYLGVPALRARYGPEFADALGGLTMDEPPMRALVRAIRICHAIYTPRRVVLLGGVGIRLAPFADAIRAAVDDRLTSVADRSWTLECGDSDFHAAIGAAHLATRPGR